MNVTMKDNFAIRYWDNGTSLTPYIMWEAHDEGDEHPNAHRSAFSGVGTLEWISREQAATILNVTEDELTPGKKFQEAYAIAWNATHTEAETVSSGTASREARLSLWCTFLAIFLLCVTNPLKLALI